MNCEISIFSIAINKQKKKLKLKCRGILLPLFLSKNHVPSVSFKSNTNTHTQRQKKMFQTL